MKKLVSLGCLLFVSIVFAQGSISGTVYANDVKGFVVVACYADAATGCNERLSVYAQLTASGPNSSYQLDNLSAGQYLVFLWRDSNASGNLEEDQDDFMYYTDAKGQPALIQPPASGIDLHFAAVQNPLTQAPSASATNPLSSPAATPSPSTHALEGSWYQGSSSGVDYYNPTTGSWAAPSGSGFKYVFNPDGSYDYSRLMQSSLYSCTMSIFGYETGTYTLQDQMLVLTPQVNKLKSEDNCHEDFNYERDEPLEPEYKLFQFGQDEFTGEITLELTFLKLNQGQLEVDPEYAASGPAIFWREK